VAFIQALGQTATIKGMSNAEFIYDSLVYAAVQKGQIANLGQQQAFNLEKALALKAQLLFSLPQETKNSQRLAQLGLPSLPIAEYLEDHPLGRAEWLLVFGLLFDALPQAQQQFEQTRQAYEALQQRIAKASKPRPLVLVGNAYDGLWYAAGGKSFLATFIRDAGGEYPWAKNQDTGGLPLEPEQVYALAPKIDYWLNVGTNQTLAQLQNLDPRQTKIRAWQSQQVYNYDARISPNGGYDIFESALVQPHRVLEDLYRIFHEKAETDLYYYRKLP
jgi:iron complex transport system substrate-binding protein